MNQSRWIKIEEGNFSKQKTLICPIQGWLYNQRKRSLIRRDVLSNSLIVPFDINFVMFDCNDVIKVHWPSDAVIKIKFQWFKKLPPSAISLRLYENRLEF